MSKIGDPVAVNRHVVQTNHDKFVNQNAVTSRLVGRFLQRTRNRVALLTQPGDRILDVGAGEGIMTDYLARSLPDRHVEALEYELEGCEAHRKAFPHVTVTQGSIYELPWQDDSYEVLTAFEVLEHIDDPLRALAEMARVARRHIVVTVPYEPFYRMGNMSRGRYLSRLGNTPGHVNHWRRSTLERGMAAHLDVAEVVPLFPWLLGTGATKATSASGIEPA